MTLHYRLIQCCIATAKYRKMKYNQCHGKTNVDIPEKNLGWRTMTVDWVSMCTIDIMGLNFKRSLSTTEQATWMILICTKTVSYPTYMYYVKGMQKLLGISFTCSETCRHPNTTKNSNCCRE